MTNKFSIFNFQFSNKSPNQAGFTMIELLAAVFLFSVMAIITASIFIRALEIERKSFAAQVVQENALAVFELMSKEIRVSDIAGPDSNCSVNNLSMTVYDNSGNGIPTTYQLNSTLGVVERVYGGVTYYVSSQDVIFTSLKFCILNSGIDNESVRVTVLAAISDRASQLSTIKIHTTTTSRNVADELTN